METLNEEIKPKSTWPVGPLPIDAPIPEYIDGLISYSRCDDRYIVEVWNDPQDKNCGNLYVFDQERDNVKIFWKHVPLTFGAVFGPDSADILDWQNIVEDFLDNKYIKENT